MRNHKKVQYLPILCLKYYKSNNNKKKQILFMHDTDFQRTENKVYYTTRYKCTVAYISLITVVLSSWNERSSDREFNSFF